MSDDPVELARRALAAADRRRSEQEAGANVEERLRRAADDEGRVTVETALDALGVTPEPATGPPFEARVLTDYAARKRGTAERFFGAGDQ